MKRLLVVGVLVLGLMVSPCFAIQYCKDFLENANPGGWSSSLKTFEDTWVLSPDETVEVDIWLNDVPEDLVTGGFVIIFDPALVNITDVMAYDTDNKGPWDPELFTYFEFAPGEWFFVVGSFDCAAPDADGDIILGKVTFEFQDLGTADVTFLPIPGFDTVVNCLGELAVYDPEILPNTVTIMQVGTTSTTTTTFPTEPTIIKAGDTSGVPGSSDNLIDISLYNPGEKIKGVSLDICDVDDYLSCTSCDTTVRSSSFSCIATEQEDGCVRVTLFSFTDVIEEGNGPILTLNYDVSPSAPSGECRNLNPENADVANENNLPVDIILESGEFCFLSQGTIIIGECDTGVMNNETEDGLTMRDLIDECAVNADGKQGKFASCVSKLTNGWKKDGLINGREKGAIQSCVTQPDIR